MKITTLALSLGLCVLAACSNSTTTESETAATSDTAAAAVQPATEEVTTQTPEPGSMEISAPTGSVTGTATAPQQNAQPVAAGMNPAHGEPGHRCDIAVGAPLNSPPSAQPAINMTPQTQSMPVTSMPPSISSPSPVPPAPSTSGPAVTAPGMNPPHGEPGHDCSIAVGAPLKK